MDKEIEKGKGEAREKDKNAVLELSCGPLRSYHCLKRSHPAMDFLK